MTAEELAALHRRAIDVPRPWTAAEFAALLPRPEVHLSGDALAFALGRCVAGEAELLTLVTAPEAQRQGLGRARLAAFEAEARRRGAREAFLEVAAENLAARALYAAAGYIEAGRRPRYYRRGDGALLDALVLRKTLRSDE